ncbi:hypothetical protein ACFQY4_05300 [Catellatospora bangladeshensis]|uniref:hypothetical protein n=1 Tax=Catellatospora bangladeshensis TaxID=310355 RepID=UPI00360D2C45
MTDKAVSKRCGCRDLQTGKPLGARCPRLRRKDGAWSPDHGTGATNSTCPPTPPVPAAWYAAAASPPAPTPPPTTTTSASFSPQPPATRSPSRRSSGRSWPPAPAARYPTSPWYAAGPRLGPRSTAALPWPSTCPRGWNAPGSTTTPCEATARTASGI